MTEEPVFERSCVVRSTVARRCREYYLRRLERTETLQRRWSLCTESTDEDRQTSATDSSDSSDQVQLDKGAQDNSDCSESPPSALRNYSVNSSDSSENSSLPLCKDANDSSDSSELPPEFRNCEEQNSVSSSSPLSSFRKCRSSFDLAMDNLRKEITSLIAQDNDLFRQLLSLNDSIAELRSQQEKSLSQWELGSESEAESLESLSDAETTSTVSPASTLSSCCSSHHLDSSSKTAFGRRAVLTSDVGCQRQRSRSSACRTAVTSDGRQRARSTLCLRCHGKGAAPLYRKRATSYLQLSWRYSGDEMDSYDSGIHVHSDSDHEIFV